MVTSRPPATSRSRWARASGSADERACERIGKHSASANADSERQRGGRMSDDAVKIPPAVSGVGGWLDDRFHGARGVRVLMRKVFPDHWSFMLGEIALWSFVILLLTGTFLALFFDPSSATVVYHGSYNKLDSLTLSEAYQSTLNISLDGP